MNRGVTNRFIDAVEIFDEKKITRLNPVPLKAEKEKNKHKKLKQIIVKEENKKSVNFCAFFV